jgi:hypothetical protein
MDFTDRVKGIFRKNGTRVGDEIKPITEEIDDDEPEEHLDQTFGGYTEEMTGIDVDDLFEDDENNVESLPDREMDYEGYLEKVFDRNNIHDLLYDLVTDDHQLSYAMFYAAIFLEIKVSKENWRKLFLPHFDTIEAVIKIYKTRRDAPYFVREKIRLSMESIDWEEFSCRKTERVQHEYGYLRIELIDFMEKLEQHNVINEFYDLCYKNYKQLQKASEYFTRDFIKKGIKENAIEYVLEVHFRNDDETKAQSPNEKKSDITKILEEIDEICEDEEDDDVETTPVSDIEEVLSETDVLESNKGVLERKYRELLKKKNKDGEGEKHSDGVLELYEARKRKTSSSLQLEQPPEKIQWVTDTIKSANKDNDKTSRIHQRLYAARYKERLVIDEAIFDLLLVQFPHFNEVIDFYKAQFRLNALTGKTFIPPVLLLGAPGLGKTKFAKDFAAALKTGYTFLDMASMTTSFVIAGLSDAWNNSKQGKIIDAMLGSPTASPVVVIDEIEKAEAQNNSGDPRTPLYQLFEENTAQAFTDEFVDYPVDVSNIIYVTCANSTEGLSEPLLTRLKVFTIEQPNPSEHAKILQSIYKGELGSAKVFPDELPGNVIHALADKSLRSAKVLISDAIAKALLEITPEDMNELKANEDKLKIDLHHFAMKQIQSKKIGF